MERETAAAREQIKAEKEAGIRTETKHQQHTGYAKGKHMLQIIVAVAAAFFIILGVWNGSAKAVHTKAANICTECVGLG